MRRSPCQSRECTSIKFYCGLGPTLQIDLAGCSFMGIELRTPKIIRGTVESSFAT